MALAGDAFASPTSGLPLEGRQAPMRVQAAGPAGP